MENSSSGHNILFLEKPSNGFSLSTTLGLSTGVVTFLFAFTLAALQLVGIHVNELLQGDFHLHGDPTLLYMSLFLICATFLLVIQYHFQEEIEED